jgi:hypothetical protein
MNLTLLPWLTIMDAGCWAVCFWWMHRISTRQDALLRELREQGSRIEEVSKAEHDLVKKMHPKVESIENDIGEVSDAVKSTR